MKKILGLDLGTNSIGWSLIQQNFEEKRGEILGLGTRVIPMSQDILGDFGRGNSISQTAERTRLRSVRRLRERHLLRRERLHRVLHILNFLPKHYAAKIDFDHRVGKFLPETETKLAYNDGHFIFQKSFEEMLADFRQRQPQLLAGNKKVPYDWTIYYLRKKALTSRIENEELAWLLLHFNQKRGYHQLRGEDAEEKENKLEVYYSMSITDVTADEPQKGKTSVWYNIILENGWVYRRESKVPLFDWKGKIRDFIVTTDLNDDGSVKKDKEGKEKRSFRSPNEDDWKLQKKKTEADVSRSGKTVGEYIYDTLLQAPTQKIKGKLVRTIERKFYKDELRQILKTQLELNPTLRDKKKYCECVEELYPHNADRQALLHRKDLSYLFLEDILYYQRPLRSQKHTVGNCPLEERVYIQGGVKKTEPLKCIPKSHPLYQEFRLWQWIYNLRIFSKADDRNVTDEYLGTHEAIASLYGFLNARKDIDQKTLFKQHFKLKDSQYRWNYVEDKTYPCNETGTMIAARLGKVTDVPEGFLTTKTETELWHIIYSVTDKSEFEKALKTFAGKHQLHADSFFDAFRKFPPFPGVYGAYSAKAVKKLLPLLRTDTYWQLEAIDAKTKQRIEKIIDGEYDETIKDRVRDKAILLTEHDHFKGLPEWLAKYIVYDRHAERAETGKWTTVADLEAWLKEFRQHSLKNPIVEQVVTEALRVVKDIWTHYGNGSQGFFDEIHIELGRELKNPAAERERLSKKMGENENTNLRIKALLTEMMNDPAVENVRPYSPMQQEILKIYEDGVLNDDIEIPEDIAKISRAPQPTASELQRYKLWLEQRYRSPYTGDIIPLNKLFTPAYEIEHIIPQSRYFDDSFSNKVICEAAVNTLKDNQTAFEFIQNHGGEIVEVGMGRKVTILPQEAYLDFIKQHYDKNRAKKNKLLALEIPEKMIERQMNDTRYISRFIMQLLSNIVRSDTNDDGVNSKNVLPVNGQVTAKLRQDWGLDALWNELILPRFERLNELTNTNDYTAYNERYQKYLPVVPLSLQKGFQKKRIDHRHHALDALVIACATRSHINYLNNQHALDRKKTKDQKQADRHDLRALLCDKRYNDGSDNHYNWIFKRPWSSFVTDVKKELERTTASIKQNLRILAQSSNSTATIADGKKATKKQQGGSNWAIRKPLHKDTVAGLISLRHTKVVSLSSAINEPENIVDKSVRKYIQALFEKGYNKKTLVKYFKESGNMLNGRDISKLAIYYWDYDSVASRVPLDTSFTKERIQTITDTGIRKILLRHLQANDNKPEQAFSPEGIEDMNRDIVSLNNGKFHQPILKVRTYEPKGNKFQVGHTGNKKHKYVEAAKGTNLFFAIYQDETGKRSFETIPLNIVIERLKQRLEAVPTTDEKGRKLVDYLSPNDLTYLPTEDELQSGAPFSLTDIDKDRLARIYKIVSFTGSRLYAVPSNVAKSIVDKIEYTQLNKVEFTPEKVAIKDICVKVKVDRLGHIILPGTSPAKKKIEESILTSVDLQSVKRKINS